MSYLILSTSNEMLGLLITMILIVISFMVFIVSRIRKCPPDKIMVIYGKLKPNQDGSQPSSICIHGGAAFIYPFIQSYKFLDLNPISFSMNLKSELTKLNESMDLNAKFTIGISTEPGMMQNAAERLLGLDSAQIQELASNIIYGQIRAVIFDNTLEDIQTKRQDFFESISRNVEQEIKIIGLRLINFKIDIIQN